MVAYVRNLKVNARVMDGDALLTPHILDQIVGAVLDVLDARKVDDHSRAQDTKIAGACCAAWSHDEETP